MSKEQFVKTYYTHAKKAEKTTGIPVLFALAQSALESGWGKHAPGNMMFGVKASSKRNYGGWEGDKQLLTTTEYSTNPNLSYPVILSGYPIKTESGKYKYRVKTYFRAYPTPYHSFVDWSGLLSTASRYKTAMENRNDPYRFAEEVAKAGYATAPNYATKVKGVMRQIETLVESTGVVLKMENKPVKKAVMPLLFVLLGLGVLVYGITINKEEVDG